MNLNELLTSIKHIEYSHIILYHSSGDDTEHMLCSDEDGHYFFTMDDIPTSKRIYNTDQLPTSVETVEFQINFNIRREAPIGI